MKKSEIENYTDKKTLHALCYLLLVLFFFTTPFYYGAQGLSFDPTLFLMFSILSALSSIGLLVTIGQIFTAYSEE